MFRTKFLAMAFALFAFLGLTQPGCATLPPNLSPVGVMTFQDIQATKTLDLVRDVAVDGAHTGLITRADALKVVNWHTAAIKILDARPLGWQTTIVTGLEQTLPLLDPKTRDKLAPYVVLIKTVFASFPF